jgi:AAA domain
MLTPLPESPQFASAANLRDCLAAGGYELRAGPASAPVELACGRTVAIVIGLADRDAAAAVEQLARARFEGDDRILVRIADPPRRALLLQTDRPFQTLAVDLVAPGGAKGRIAILGDGAQIPAFTQIPEFARPGNGEWSGLSPLTTDRDELAHVRDGDEARAFLDDAVELLTVEHRFATPTVAATKAATISAKELNTMRFAPIKYVVPGIIVEGLTLIAGKPKMGKSWMMLHAAIAVARGGFTLGNIKCTEGDVLYCALEDNLRRLQSRMTMLLGLQQWPERLHFRCEMPRLAEGGLAWIKDWIAAVPRTRLIIIDTLAMVRAPKKREESSYDGDYAAVKALRDVANQHGVAIVLVHHLRKAEADDPFDTVSGTLGLTGAPDTILVLRRDGAGSTVLHGRGRDLIELEKAIMFNADACTWTIVGDAGEVQHSAQRVAIQTAIEEAGEPIGPKDIADVTGMKHANVRFLLRKMLKDGAIEKVAYGKYRRRTPPANPDDEHEPERERA